MSISIYEDYFTLLRQEATSHPGVTEAVYPSPAHVEKALNICRFFLTNAKKGTEILLQGTLSKLDPIVGENSCQIRAMMAISAYNSKELREEAERIKATAGALLGLIEKYEKADPFRFFPLFDKPFEKIIQALNVELFITPRMSGIIHSHLLTCAKFFSVGRDGRESSGIKPEMLQRKLSKKLDLSCIRSIEHTAREAIAQQSISFIQEEGGPLEASSPLQAPFIRLLDVGPFHFPISCEFYNFKRILSLLGEQAIPILIKEYVSDDEPSSLHKKDRTKLFFYAGRDGSTRSLSQDEVNLLDPRQPIFVFECRLFDRKEEVAKRILEQGLVNLALANVALIPQYSQDDDISLLDDEAKKEILHFRRMGEELCQRKSPFAFAIEHTHAATVQEEIEVVR